MEEEERGPAPVGSATSNIDWNGDVAMEESTPGLEGVVGAETPVDEESEGEGNGVPAMLTEVAGTNTEWRWTNRKRSRVTR